ncbi:hypothetical protein D3C85_1724670 [compost metagenome]
MPFDLHFAEDYLQGADKIRNTLGQGQVDQLHTRRHRQTGVSDYHDVAMPQ